MTSTAIKCCVVTLVLQVCICTVAGARDASLDSASGLTTSSAVGSNSALVGNQHRRELLAAPAPAPALAPALGPAPMLQPGATPASSTGATGSPGATAVPVFSTSAVVPAITSVASLSGFATVADFDMPQQDRFTSTLEANILRVQGVVANCTVTKVELGSIKVTNTIAFPGADEAAATAARDSVATALSSSNAVDYFGTSFGEVTVSNVETTTAANPAKSGAAAFGVSLAGIIGGLTILACTMI